MTNFGNSLKKRIGIHIAKLRNEANLTQTQLAEKLGIGLEAVSRLERGTASPSLERLEQLANALNCGILEFFTTTSNHPDDQIEQIREMFIGLDEEDRDIILDTVKKLYGRFTK